MEREEYLKRTKYKAKIKWFIIGVHLYVPPPPGSKSRRYRNT